MTKKEAKLRLEAQISHLKEKHFRNKTLCAQYQLHSKKTNVTRTADDTRNKETIHPCPATF